MVTSVYASLTALGIGLTDEKGLIHMGIEFTDLTLEQLCDLMCGKPDDDCDDDEDEEDDDEI